MSHPTRLLAAALACALAATLSPARAADTRSWIYIEPSSAERVLVEGEQWEVPVEYHLDPAEDRGGTELYLWVAGPFIYLPDGKYTTERGHVPYPNMARRVTVEPGRRRHTFTFTVPPALPGNRLLIICYFRDADGNRWPWEVRRDSIWFRRQGGFFELETDKPGNLLTYDDPVRIVARLRNVQAAGAQKTLAYTVRDVTGAAVAQGEVAFTVEQDGQQVPIDLDLDRRGTFLIEAEVDGWEKRTTTFCRVPDVLAITKGAPTPFGMTNVVSPGAPERIAKMCQIARRLGLTSCRTFTRWYDLEPAPGLYKLDPWEQALDVGNQHGIDTWLCLWGPPAWALRDNEGNFSFSYSAFRCDWEAWEEFVEAATTRFKGKLYGWEWLNEITPGGTDRPVDDYLTLCRIGTETAKKIDPDITTIMAGGLWPRSFRTEMLRAGVGKHIDVMPIHYSNGGAVREAREDLDAAGLGHVAVWDDETAKGINAWKVPQLERLTETEQCNWVLTQWTDELAAGCEKIIYFGGVGNACGDYSYLLDDLSPRPVAATLAVFSSKLFGAKPVGTFSLGKAGLLHLFDRGGEAVLVCSSYDQERVSLTVGAESVTITDYQGNETELAAADGIAELQLAPLRYFVEGADLDVLKAYVVPEVVTHRAALKRSRLVETPRLAMIRGRPSTFSIRLTNLYQRELTGSFRLGITEGWPPSEEVAFALSPGEHQTVPVALSVPEGAEATDYDTRVRFRFAWDKLPEITKPFVLSVVSPEMLGNLMPNGDFETPDAAGDGPEGFGMDGQTKMWAGTEELGDGLGARCLRFANTGDQWGWCGRTIDLRGGQTYLYTAWVWNKDMHAGSNITQYMADGSEQTLYDNQVFTCGSDSSYWQMHAARVKTPEGMERAGFTPVVNGKGWALFDNLRVTFFEGTDFAAECYRTGAPPTIDGKLDDWITKCPVPLIGKNQLTVKNEAYAWTPENLSAIGYLMWDETSLYVALRVRDDTHHATATAEDTASGDSAILAFDPSNRGPQAMGKAFSYYLSSARPGGGSGAHTIFRPQERSAGLSSGQLFRDSSVYEMAIAAGDGRTVYELRIPWGELGGTRPSLGGKVAFSIQVNDSDGEGTVAHLNWGEGISPAWRPQGFGVVTFVE